MGLFGGNDEPSESERLMQEQYDLNRQELELKKANLYKTKLEIIKGQGGEQWTPDRSAGIPTRKGDTMPHFEGKGIFKGVSV
jgi:hypothetical protein